MGMEADIPAGPFRDKIRSREALRDKVAELHRAGKRVVFTNGCFDLLHRGHVRYLAAARGLGDVLIVGLNSDASARAIKGPGRPICTAGERAEVLAALGAVDYVTVFDERDPAALIAALEPDILVKGGDWQAAEIVGSDFVTARGGSVVSLPYVPGASTTDLVGRILARQATVHHGEHGEHGDEGEARSDRGKGFPRPLGS